MSWVSDKAREILASVHTEIEPEDIERAIRETIDKCATAVLADDGFVELPGDVHQARAIRDQLRLAKAKIRKLNE